MECECKVWRCANTGDWQAACKLHKHMLGMRDQFINSPGNAEEARKSWCSRTNVKQEWYPVLKALRDRTETTKDDQMICNTLHEVNLLRCLVVWFCLIEVHHTTRLVWSRLDLAKTHQQWLRVLFTMLFNNGRLHLWRQHREWFQGDTVREHDHYGERSIMIWSGIGMNYRTGYRAEGNLKDCLQWYSSVSCTPSNSRYQTRCCVPRWIRQSPKSLHYWWLPSAATYHRDGLVICLTWSLPYWIYLGQHGTLRQANPLHPSIIRFDYIHKALFACINACGVQTCYWPCWFHLLLSELQKERQCSINLLFSISNYYAVFIRTRAYFFPNLRRLSNWSTILGSKGSRSTFFWICIHGYNSPCVL